MKDNLSLFTTGFIQVFFVSLNTYFLSVMFYPGVIVAAFMISLIWSYNIKKIAFSSIHNRIFYSLGATTGSAIGLFMSSFIVKLI